MSLKKIFHWGPLIALGIIKCISFMMTYCCFMWWPPLNSLGGLLHLMIFFGFSGLTLYHFLTSITIGPGFLPRGWVPRDPGDTVFLQYCDVCLGFKAPRAHHCRKCGSCVLKMDHHCPWINRCVGHRNHGNFVLFLSAATLGCMQASITFSCCLYRIIHRMWYLYYGQEPIIYLSLPGLVMLIFCLGLSVGVVLAVGMLLFFQLKGIYYNRTAIEEWIVAKAYGRQRDGEPDFIYPYDLGWRENIKQVLNWSCIPVGDGIDWPLVEGCDEYMLTREQLQQKSLKRLRMRTYTVISNYSGSWFPLSYGWRVVCHPPFTDESRIALKIGDLVHVTRWKRYWLFGDKVLENGIYNSMRIRGWFPSSAVVPVTEGPMLYPQSKKAN